MYYNNNNNKSTFFEQNLLSEEYTSYDYRIYIEIKWLSIIYLYKLKYADWLIRKYVFDLTKLKILIRY